MLPKIDGIIKKHISILHSDDALKALFPKDCFNANDKRNKNLKELIAPSIYPKKYILLTCSKCLEQYVRSAVKFKTRFDIHKSDIKTKKERRGSATHVNSKCYHDTNPFWYLKVQLIEQAQSNDLGNIEDVLRNSEKYWQSQLFTVAKAMNKILNLYSSKRKGIRKR